MKNKGLYIPKSKRIRGLGLTVFCKHPECFCNRDDLCKLTGKDLRNCPHGHKYHSYKQYVHVKGTDNERRTKFYREKELDKVIPQAFEFKRKVQEGNENVAVKKPVEEKERKPNETRPISLVHLTAKYRLWVDDEGVPSHMKNNFSEGYKNDIKRSMDVLNEALLLNDHDPEEFSVMDLDDTIVGEVYDYLKKNKKFKGRTVNKYIGDYITFFDWMKDKGYELNNCFKNVRREKVNHHPKGISEEEFNGMMEKITPENGTYMDKNERWHSMYRNWLKFAFRAALETGLRREELTTAKFSQISKDENGNPIVLKIPNLKVNRIQKRDTEESMKWVYVPVSNSFRQLLSELNYDELKDTDKYLIAPEIEDNRTKVMGDVLSRSFSHFYGLLGIGKKSFKCLRKQWITSVTLQYPNARAITRFHSNDAVENEHYLDHTQIAKAVSGFEVFPKKISERNNELQEKRIESKSNQINLER